MAYPTFSDLVQKCLVELRQEPGISVQQYSEDIIAAILQRQFNIFFDHYWWPLYTQRGDFTLDGVSGFVTTDLSNIITRFDDIRYIWLENSALPLTILPPTLNFRSVSGTVYYIFAPHREEGKIFRIVPITTTGTIQVMYRVRPKPFLPNDEVLIDADLLVLATCYNYLSDDEDSPSAVKKFAEAAGKREAQLREALNKGPIPIGSHSTTIPNTWMMGP